MLMYQCIRCSRLLASHAHTREHFEETGHKVVEVLTINTWIENNAINQVNKATPDG